MIPKDLFQKVRKIEITTSRLVTDVFAGQYHSVFKGQGIEFDEVREYQYGDDIRMIDRNVTARTGIPHIKKFVEERELTVIIIVDVSLSSQFASQQALKSQLAAEISALLTFSAIRNNDKVGLITFTEQIEKFIPPRKGRQHVLRIIREVLYPPEHTSSVIGQSTDVIAALEYLNHVSKRKSIVFLISDFLDARIWKPQIGFTDEFRRIISITNRRHDLIAVTLDDPAETRLPNCGLVMLHDAETGERKYVDTSDAQVRRSYQESNLKRLAGRATVFRRNGVDHVAISTDTAYTDELVKFFLRRRKR